MVRKRNPEKVPDPKKAPKTHEVYENLSSDSDVAPRLELNATEDQEMVDACVLGEFEDPYDDEFESEDEDVDVAEGDMDEDEDDEKNSDDEKMDTGASFAGRDVEESGENSVRVYLPGQPLQDGEVLEHDTSVYHMLHSLNMDWPSLSFDILRDRLGNNRTKFPHTSYLVTGTQADSASRNHIDVIKMSHLCSTLKEDAHEDTEMQSDSEDEAKTENQPIVERSKIPFFGGVNRIRAMKNKTSDAQIIAAWSDARREVYVYDITKRFAWLDDPCTEAKSEQIHTVGGHKDEGFALDWSARSEGSLVSGDCKGIIRLTLPNQAGFKTQLTQFCGHTASVEDLQWSPTETTVFASCSADGSIAIFDTRLGAKPGISARVGTCDVNVISWNALTPFLLASGHDDGEFSIWDLRAFAKNSETSGNDKKSKITGTNSVNAVPAARFEWHKGAITSIEWHGHEESMIAVSGADNQITIWDLSTERDDDAEGTAAASGKDDNSVVVPPQLLFVHQGQEDIKELHWHPQIPGCLISTALSGINIFKTINS